MMSVLCVRVVVALAEVISGSVFANCLSNSTTKMYVNSGQTHCSLGTLLGQTFGQAMIG